MKARISKNRKYIRLSEKPTATELGGLKLMYGNESGAGFPSCTTDLIAGKVIYYLPKDNEVTNSIHQVLIRNQNTWELIPLKIGKK